MNDSDIDAVLRNLKVTPPIAAKEAAYRRMMSRKNSGELIHVLSLEELSTIAAAGLPKGLYDEENKEGEEKRTWKN